MLLFSLLSDNDLFPWRSFIAYLKMSTRKNLFSTYNFRFILNKKIETKLLRTRTTKYFKQIVCQTIHFLVSLLNGCELKNFSKSVR